ncbi:MAG: hypothetical protein INH41_00770 [Myxococcaceae bacterium]|jgi:hypothetical protein|nr:hypothetical protein [Myxococcaceae bacterium]MCA3010910.1 hypothetical protein [Myxococcaceae bacterium]
MNKKSAFVLLVFAMVASSCAGPCVVRSMGTTRDGKFRLMFERNAGFGTFEQGIVDCTTDSKGAGSDC